MPGRNLALLYISGIILEPCFAECPELCLSGLFPFGGDICSPFFLFRFEMNGNSLFDHILIVQYCYQEQESYC